MIDRRHFLRLAGGTLGTLALAGGAGKAFAKNETSDKEKSLADRFAAIERESGGRLGVAVFDTHTGSRYGHREGERFPMCSTFKFLLATAVLLEVDRGKERLDRVIPIAKSDLIFHSPLAETRVGKGATVAELCEATMIFSDNAAANLLLPIIGGPEGMTGFARSIGDTVTRLDRIEPHLGEAKPGDQRDTTSPLAMVANLDHILVSNIVLGAMSHDRITDWLKRNTTGDQRLRAGLPKAWGVGDKTGSGSNGTTNDIAIVWPPGRKPVLIATYLTQSKFDDDGRNGVLRDVAREVAKTIGA